MKKEIIIVIILLSLIFGINIICQKYMDMVIADLNEKFEELNQLSKNKLEEHNEDIDFEFNFKVTQMYESWNNYKDKLSLFLEHDELDKIEDSVVSIRSYTEVKDYEDSVAELNRCVFLLKHLKQKESVRLVNLF